MAERPFPVDELGTVSRAGKTGRVSRKVMSRKIKILFAVTISAVILAIPVLTFGWSTKSLFYPDPDWVCCSNYDDDPTACEETPNCYWWETKNRCQPEMDPNGDGMGWCWVSTCPEDCDRILWGGCEWGLYEEDMCRYPLYPCSIMSAGGPGGDQWCCENCGDQRCDGSDRCEWNATTSECLYTGLVETGMTTAGIVNFSKEIFSDLSPALLLPVGLPIAFWVIRKVITTARAG